MDDDTQSAKERARCALDASAGAEKLSSGKLQCRVHMHRRRTHLRDTRQNRRRRCALCDIPSGLRPPHAANLLFFIYRPRLARVLQNFQRWQAEENRNMSGITIAELALRLMQGELVPYLGPGALTNVHHRATGTEMPADSGSLILALHNGRPVARRLMYEFSRAAMDMELKRGRKAVTRFLTDTYGHGDWTRSALHEWLASIKASYIVDINRDTQLQEAWADTPHTLIRGIARIAGTDYRFRIHAHDGNVYREITQEEVDPALPILFKPMGSPTPDPVYIASDADYVDYITELMGGFAIPDFLKIRRKDLQYLLLGMRLNRDTERMVLADIVYAAGNPCGWALIPDPTGKERRFCKRLDIEIVEGDIGDLLAFTRDHEALTESVTTVGC
jgi:hypothetical protein